MGVTIDEYDGQGGSYLLDPKSGKRKLVERTEPATIQPPTEVTENAAPDEKASDPEQDRDDVRN